MKPPIKLPRSHRSVAIAVIAAAVLALAGASYTVHRRHQVIRLGYELSEATAELRRLQEEERRLRLESSVLTNPERIERLARGLGMVRPGPEQTRDARPGAVASLEPRR